MAMNMRCKSEFAKNVEENAGAGSVPGHSAGLAQYRVAARIGKVHDTCIEPARYFRNPNASIDGERF
jgi:hypothetical protein